MYNLFLLLNLSSAYAIQFTPAILEDTVITFSEWISLLLSRGVYVILATLIAFCFVVTTVKNKFCERKEADECKGKDETWSSLFLNKPNDQFWLPGTREQLAPSSNGKNTDTLMEAVETLKTELEKANRSRAELEETLALIEQKKDGEMIAIWKEESVQIKKESEESEIQLKIALEEKNDLSREIEQLRREREEKLSESAFKEKKKLVDSLDSARSEIEVLKNQMKDMKAERDMAVRLASDMMEKAKGVTQRDKEQRQLIEDMIDSELKRVREEDDVKSGENDLKTELDQIESMCLPDNPPAEGTFKSESSLCSKSSVCGTKCILHSDIRSLRMAVGDGPLTICNNLNDLFIAVQSNAVQSNVESPEEPRTTTSGSESSSVDEEGDGNKKILLTRSPAFRAFLNSFTQRNS
ncbi:uncharacterized protein LOC106662660 [Cimex lectularius]|uniref:Uncharacterized protein n=1 Tax=Cimex lectularius TaxID=79782 RepID=A0A8I6REP2_CIMLE|nr:uncharacterized protein LOC106662660 [Cimex lectularius]